MRDEGLGPNGAVLKAMELLSKAKIPMFKDDFVLVDTPGQLEVFAFHTSGPKILGQLPILLVFSLLTPLLGLMTFQQPTCIRLPLHIGLE